MRLLTRTDENKVAGFMKKTRKNIANSLLNTDLNPEQIHELRKLLKSYYYLDNCLEPATTSATPAAMADLTDLLGKWHDWHVIEAHLAETADSDGAASDEVTRITAIRAGILLEKEILMDKIKIAISTSEFVESQ
jgi:CHAD domain-containing protein